MDSKDGVTMNRSEHETTRSKCSGDETQPRSNQPICKLPWMMTYEWIKTYKDVMMTECWIADPLSHMAETVRYDFYDPKREASSDMKVCASKHHYLLLSLDREDKTTSFFSYNPFTKDFINLPDLGSDFNTATFSSIPSSSECVFIALTQFDNNISLSTCSSGDQKWNTLVCHGSFPPIRSVVFMNGVFYCLFGQGILGIFNASQQDWRMLENLKPLEEVFLQEEVELHMLESEGELLLACFDKVRDCFSVFRLDQSQIAWVRLQSLENRTLFCGCGSYFTLTVEKEDKLVNKLYYLQGNEGCRVYSLENGERYMSEEVNMYNWIWKNGYLSLGITWIEPPDPARYM